MDMVGIFAGRGDVVIAMMLSGIIGVWIGYNVRKIIEWIKSKRKSQ